MGLIRTSIFSIMLNLDMFVISLIFGTSISRTALIPILACIIAILQSLIPLSGFLLGNLIGHFSGYYGHIIGAIILFAVGALALFERKDENDFFEKSLVLIYLGAGLDDLLTGVSLGTFGGTIYLFISTYFLASLIMNFIALNIGKWIKKTIHFPINILVGFILIGMALLQVFETH